MPWQGRLRQAQDLQAQAPWLRQQVRLRLRRQLALVQLPPEQEPVQPPAQT